MNNAQQKNHLQFEFLPLAGSGASCGASPSFPRGLSGLLSRTRQLVDGERRGGSSHRRLHLAIAFDSRVAAAYHNRCFARQRKGDLAGALSDCNRAIELIPRYAEAHLNRGTVRGVLGEFDAAISDFSKAIEINPRDARAWANRGAARLMLGRLAEAEADFARCRELGGTIKPEAERLLREARERRARTIPRER